MARVRPCPLSIADNHNRPIGESRVDTQTITDVAAAMREGSFTFHDRSEVLDQSDLALGNTCNTSTAKVPTTGGTCVPLRGQPANTRRSLISGFSAAVERSTLTSAAAARNPSPWRTRSGPGPAACRSAWVCARTSCRSLPRGLSARWGLRPIIINCHS
jgi:hypothetical protein